MEIYLTICADQSYPLPDNGSVGSAEDGPTYVLEHLATFRVSPESDLVYPADGMRRLLHMEKTSGIWTQKMMLRLDKKWVCIQSHENGVSFWYVQFFPTFEKAISMSAVRTLYLYYVFNVFNMDEFLCYMSDFDGWK